MCMKVCIFVCHVSACCWRRPEEGAVSHETNWLGPVLRMLGTKSGPLTEQLLSHLPLYKLQKSKTGGKTPTIVFKIILRQSCGAPPVAVAPENTVRAVTGQLWHNKEGLSDGTVHQRLSLEEVRLLFTEKVQEELPGKLLGNFLYEVWLVVLFALIILKTNLLSVTVVILTDK